MAERFIEAFANDLRETLVLARTANDTNSADALANLLAAIEAGRVVGGTAVAFRIRFSRWLEASPCRREIWRDHHLSLRGVI